jgi:hypothetical protein
VEEGEEVAVGMEGRECGRIVIPSLERLKHFAMYMRTVQDVARLPFVNSQRRDPNVSQQRMSPVWSYTALRRPDSPSIRAIPFASTAIPPELLRFVDDHLLPTIIVQFKLTVRFRVIIDPRFRISRTVNLLNLQRNVHQCRIAVVVVVVVVVLILLVLANLEFLESEFGLTALFPVLDVLQDMVADDIDGVEDPLAQL